MAYAKVKASYLVEKFLTMVVPGQEWVYVTGGASKGKVDCSGAFSYWYKQAGSYMYHGSNTMWRKYTTEKGKIGEINLVPGMAVFKVRADGNEPSAFKNDGQGNFYHVGLYIGDNQVVEAKSTKDGCVISKLSAWGYAARLKNTDYDTCNEEANEIVSEEISEDAVCNSEQKGVVKCEGRLNIRMRPDKNSIIVKRITSGTTLSIVGENGAWYKVNYNGTTGYVMKQFIKLLLSQWRISGIVTDEYDAENLIRYAETIGITLTKEAI